MSTTRIYKIHHAATKTYRLVRAPNVSQALRFVASDSFVASVAGQDDLVCLISSGIKVETAKEDDQTGDLFS